MTRSGTAAIPKQVSAARAIAARQRFVGRLALSQMPRLAAQLADTSGAVEVELEAGRDGAGLGWLTGTISGALRLSCQRGLHPYAWDCRIETRLRLVASEAEEEQAMREAEACLVENDLLMLRDLVEDELLLALPMMPRCDDPDCVKRLK